MSIQSLTPEQIEATLAQHPEQAMAFEVARPDGTSIVGTTILVCDNATHLRQHYPDPSQAPYCASFDRKGLEACLDATSATLACTMIFNGIPGLLVEVSLKPELPADQDMLISRLRHAALILQDAPVALFTADPLRGLHMDVGLWGFIRAEHVTQQLVDRTAHVLDATLNRLDPAAIRFRIPVSISEEEVDAICDAHGEIAEPFQTFDALGQDFTGVLTVVAENSKDICVDVPLAQMARILRTFEQDDLELLLQLNHYSYAFTAILNGVPGMLIEVAKKSLCDDEVAPFAPVQCSSLMADLAQISHELSELPALVIASDSDSAQSRSPGVWVFIPAGFVTAERITRIADTAHRIANNMSLAQVLDEAKKATVVPITPKANSDWKKALSGQWDF